MKKNIQYLIPIFLALFIFSCTKNNMECDDVDYDTSFVIVKDQMYCFPDGNFFIVDDMINGYCPCNVACIWEGEMALFYKYTVGDIVLEKTVGSSSHTDTLFISDDYYIKFKNVQLKEPCSNSNPNPKIEQATVIVREM